MPQTTLGMWIRFLNSYELVEILLEKRLVVILTIIRRLYHGLGEIIVCKHCAALLVLSIGPYAFIFNPTSLGEEAVEPR